ncbi:hypothetical protein GCM10009733_068360 [Nonomuraea maheshkhaliensis]|uniref:DUF664 domain-containing protein n=1 Tax=Nonomuraea maheshkhaliensis TaxID=419590 RepID=A0ABP4RUI2_9ACTN
MRRLASSAWSTIRSLTRDGYRSEIAVAPLSSRMPNTTTVATVILHLMDRQCVMRHTVPLS